MYHPAIAQKRLDRLVDQVRGRTDPRFAPKEHSVAEVDRWCNHLDGAYDAKKGQLRGLRPDEERFVLNEILLSKADARYWLTRYPKIKTKAARLERMVLLESQEIILEKIAAAEMAALAGTSGDGVLLQILKARQLGASTLAEALIAHRCFLYANLMALIGGDVPDQTSYLFDMLERVHENLPWWMRPYKTNHVKDYEMYFQQTDTLIRCASGKSVRGGDSFNLGRGQMGRGKTPHLNHLSELSTWDNPEQIDDSLMPAIPRSAHTLALFESTARGRGNWWHDTWVASKKGLGRLVPVFIPWYAESRTYRRPAPADWAPSALTLAHAEKAKVVSAQWCGKPIVLDREQLFWWETARAEAIERRKLHIFLAEYAADDMEAFQNTGRSVFPYELLHEIRQEQVHPPTVIDVRPRVELLVEAGGR